MFSCSIIQNVKNAFHISLYAALLALGMLSFSQSLDAVECSSESSSSHHHSGQKLGRRLVTFFWNNVKAQNVSVYSDLIADRFHGLNIQGIYNKCQQVSGLKSLTVTKFKLKHLKTVKYHHTLEISYDFHAKGVGIVSGPSIDIWHRHGKEWKLISHSYVPFLNESGSD